MIHRQDERQHERTDPVRTAGVRRRRLVVVICCVLAVAGSGSACRKAGVARYRVTGRVTYDGKDLPAGIIYFEPDSARGNLGATGYATIVDGRFDTAVKGKGAIGGAMLVRVNGHEKPANPHDESPGIILVQDHVEQADFPQAAVEWNVAVPLKK